MLSAYHVGRPMAPAARELIQQLPLHFSFSDGRNSLPFSELAYALEALGETRQQKEQYEILTQLFERAQQVSGNSILEIYLLLKMMLPSYDNESVYGMKTRRLMHVMIDALRKTGHSESCAFLRQWLEQVPLQNSMLAKGKGIVCLPELPIATQCTRASSSSARGSTTVVNVAVVCRMLTTVYLSAKSTQEQLETAQSEIIRQLIEEGSLSFQEWITVMRLLLKEITMGVGLQTVLKALPMNNARECFAKQMDLARLAEMCVSGVTVPSVVCGVPFRPMTCDMSRRYMRSPYLMQWMFPKNALTKDGRIGLLDNLLVIIGDDWYVNALQANKKERLYVNLQSDAAYQTIKARQPLVIRLREFQKAHMLQGAKGQIIHFSMTDANNIVQMTLSEVTEHEDCDQFQHTREWEEYEDISLSDLILVKETNVKEKTYKVAVKGPVVRPSTGSRTGLRSDVSKGKAKEKTKEVPMLMVQQKLDGDRIQIHIKTKDEIKLFTKWGKDVTELYSSVCDDLVRLKLDQHTPCILDGELLVVNSLTEEAMPWSSTKWTYNKPLSELTGTSDSIIALSYNGDEEDGAYGTINNRADEEGEGRLLYAYHKNIRKLEPGLRGQIITHGILRVVFYDIIVHKGIAVHELGCNARFKLLTTQLSAIMDKSTHCRVLKDAHNLNSLDKLMDLLKNAVQNGREGLVIKDPLASYEFGSSRSIQKLKLSGPEINTGVLGIGGTLSGNPRMCGLLTCILLEHDIVVSYCRVEILEGDESWKAFAHVMNELDSRVSVSLLQAAMRAGKAVTLPKYTVRMIMTPDGGRKVVWRSVKEENNRYQCEALIMPGDLADVQWLVSPHECRLGLSVHGDLKPVESNEPGEKLWKPRNPVGRLELRNFQMSKLDNHNQIMDKYKYAQEVETCADRHALRRIAELRSLPPQQIKLKEMARVLTCMQNGSGLWPQNESEGLPSIVGFNHLLRTAGLKELSPDERLALYSGKIQTSQWRTWEYSHGSRVQTETDAVKNAEKVAELEMMSARFKEITAAIAAKGSLAPILRSKHFDIAHSSWNYEQEMNECELSPRCSLLETMQEEYLKEYEVEEDNLSPSIKE